MSIILEYDNDFITPEKKFAFVISSYNSCKFIDKNLNYVITQNYPKHLYRILYANDCSTDDSEKILNLFIKNHSDVNMILLNNKTRKGPAYSRHELIKQTNDDEICVFLDGDDFLINLDTLNILNKAYCQNDIYATFGSMKDKNYQYTRWKKNYKRNNKDKIPNYYPHLRTSYSYICKNIPTDYLKYNDKWLMYCTDYAIFICICELINNKFAYIKNILIDYNLFNSKHKKEGYDYQKNNKIKSDRQKYIKHIKHLKPLNNIII